MTFSRAAGSPAQGRVLTGTRGRLHPSHKLDPVPLHRANSFLGHRTHQNLPQASPGLCSEKSLMLLEMALPVSTGAYILGHIPIYRLQVTPGYLAAARPCSPSLTLSL